jgi:hypothetical protein
MLENFFDNPLYYLILILGNWWWAFLPFFVFPLFRSAWLLKRREEWEKKQKYKFLEIVVPNEVEKPLFSMEQVFSNIWPIYTNLDGRMNWKKKYWYGQRQDHLTIEIVGNGIAPRFFLRVHEDQVDTIEAAFFAQYPELEFRETDDSFMQEVSWNLPDHKWDMYGFDEVLERPDFYPIKTYNQFFEMKPDNVKEEKRMDPINTLIEGLRKLNPQERAWVQLRLEPIAENDGNYLRRGKALVNKLVHRKDIKGLSIVSLLWGQRNSSREERELIPPEMKLTPGEREEVELVEDKIGKNSYKVNIRCILFGQKNIFKPSRKALLEEYFSSFSAPDLNIFKKFSKTKTKIQYFFIKRRTFFRKRQIFSRYLLRETPLYPRKGGTYILNIEELATIFHPPISSAKSAVFLQRVSAKKGDSPDNLPIED